MVDKHCLEQRHITYVIADLCVHGCLINVAATTTAAAQVATAAVAAAAKEQHEQQQQ